MHITSLRHFVVHVAVVGAWISDDIAPLPARDFLPDFSRRIKGCMGQEEDEVGDRRKGIAYEGLGSEPGGWQAVRGGIIAETLPGEAS